MRTIFAQIHIDKLRVIRLTLFSSCIVSLLRKNHLLNLTVQPGKNLINWFKLTVFIIFGFTK